MKGIQCLAKEMDLEINVKRADFSALKSCELVRQMGKEVDAIVCASDLMALGAKNALLEMGIERPLCGFDGISLMGYAGQEMYTIRQNFSEISARAMEELQRLMSGKEGRNVEMNYTLLQMNCNTVIY